MAVAQYWVTHFDSLQGFFNVGMDRQTKVPHHMTGTILNLGPGRKVIKGTHGNVVPLGLETGWNADKDMIPHGNETLDGIIALHFLEHVKYPADILRDCQRVLKTGCPMNIVVPYGAGHLAVQDLTHRNFFNEDTWRTLFQNEYYNPEGDPEPWQWEITLNVIMGVKGSNLALLTQLVKTSLSIPTSTSHSTEKNFSTGSVGSSQTMVQTFPNPSVMPLSYGVKIPTPVPASTDMHQLSLQV